MRCGVGFLNISLAEAQSYLIVVAVPSESGSMNTSR